MMVRRIMLFSRIKEKHNPLQHIGLGKHPPWSFRRRIENLPNVERGNVQGMAGHDHEKEAAEVEKHQFAERALPRAQEKGIENHTGKSRLKNARGHKVVASNVLPGVGEQEHCPKDRQRNADGMMCG